MSQGLQSVKVGHYRGGGQKVRTIQMEEARKWELYRWRRPESENYTDGGGQKVRTIQMEEARRWELYRWRRPESENYTDGGGQNSPGEPCRQWGSHFLNPHPALRLPHTAELTTVPAHEHAANKKSVSLEHMYAQTPASCKTWVETASVSRVESGWVDFIDGLIVFHKIIWRYSPLPSRLTAL